jgi:rhamnogalacturonyl hydrolase YesR
MELYRATGEKAYIDYMDRQWGITSISLYDPTERLYFRDSSYLNKREKNGKRVFWSRGNGWVLAGYARVLKDMPQDYPNRPRHIKQYKEMASRIAYIQSKDGLWRTGLLDPKSYPLPEISGSALFGYALASGINQDILDRKK